MSQLLCRAAGSLNRKSLKFKTLAECVCINYMKRALTSGCCAAARHLQPAACQCGSRPSVVFFSSFPFILEHESTVEAGSVARGRGLLGLKVCVLVSCLAVRPDTLRRKSTSGGGSGVPLHSSHALPSLAGWPQPRAECKSVSCLEKKTFL